jgi:hypothetical protein
VINDEPISSALLVSVQVYIYIFYIQVYVADLFSDMKMVNDATVSVNCITSTQSTISG